MKEEVKYDEKDMFDYHEYKSSKYGKDKSEELHMKQRKLWWIRNFGIRQLRF